MSNYEDRVNDLAEYITMYDTQVTPEEVGRYATEAILDIPYWYKGEDRKRALREKSAALIWLRNRAQFIGAGWSLEGDLDAITNELNKPQEPPPYPERIMRRVRQSLGVEEFDTSHDDEIRDMPRDMVFDKCLTWEGIIGYGFQIRSWIEDIYKVSL